MQNTEFLGYLVAFAIPLVASIIAIIKPIVNLNTSIQKLNDSIDQLNTLSNETKERVAVHDAKLFDHDIRLHTLEVKNGLK